MTTTQDLIAQLKKDAHHHIDGQMAGLMDEAADALETLQAEVANLRRKQRVTEGIAGDYKEQLPAYRIRVARMASSPSRAASAVRLVAD